MTVCVIHQDHEAEEGWLVCRRAWGRLAGALHQIPRLLSEVNLSKGVGSAPKVSGSREHQIPPRIDALDLTLSARRASLFIGGQDQVGHLSVATELEFWASDWADLRNEGRPFPSVPDLCRWLLDRLDWACQHHYALDEFAEVTSRIFRTLHGVNGNGAARPKLMEAPCPTCHLLTLTQCYEESNIDCENVDCRRSLTPDEYARYVRQLIEENTP